MWAYSALGALGVGWLTVARVAPALQYHYFAAPVWSLSTALLALGVVGFWLMKWWGVSLLVAAGFVTIIFTALSFSPTAFAMSVAFSAVVFGPAFAIAGIYRDRFRP